MDEQKTKIQRFLHRDLSWLAFNHRVLQEAASETVPLLERLKFLAIFSSNLDEFFRVRVSALRSFKALAKSERRVERKPKRTLRKITKTVNEQQIVFGEIFQSQIIPGLKKAGINLLDCDSYTAQDRATAKRYFEEEVKAKINAISIDLTQDSTVFLDNRDLFLVVTFENEQVIGLVDIPSDEMNRFYLLSESSDQEGGQRVTFLDDIIRDNLDQLFPNHKESFAITVSRDAELYIQDEYEGDLIEKLYAAVQQRDNGMPTRFLYDQQMPSDLLQKLKVVFGLTTRDLIPGGKYHHFDDFFQFPSIVDAPHLQYPPLPPLPHPAFQAATSLLEVIWQKDQILHFPYQSFHYLPDMLQEALGDQDCIHIKMTLYRTSKNSVVGSTLLDALEKGKKVTVFIEAKARFDEENNIFWGKKLQEAGATVIFSYPGVKVHSKLLLVQFINEKKDIAYIGTGNFNEKTALVYTDHALITARPSLTSEVDRIFGILTRTSIIPRARKLLVSPFTARSGIEERIEREIEHSAKGRPAAIFFKMNSLEDKKMVRKLQAAAAAGVKVRLIVRGICILNTDYTEGPNPIEAISIVDRFLEHPRLYHFLNDGDAELFIGSADLMERNLDRRIEVLAPIIDPDIYQELLELLELQWRDNTKARILDGAFNNSFRRPAAEQEVIHSQYDIYRYLERKV